MNLGKKMKLRKNTVTKIAKKTMKMTMKRTTRMIMTLGKIRIVMIDC